ncbi:hypothetical protein IGJ68_002157 [Enterococcus sp. DIV0564]
MSKLKMKQIYYEVKEFLLSFFSVVGVIYLFSSWTEYPWEQKYIILFSVLVSLIEFVNTKLFKKAK